MEKKVYKKGDAQRARTAAAPARPAKAPAARQAAPRPPAPAAPARRTVSTAKATVCTAKAAVHTAPKRRRKSRVLPVLLCFLLTILILSTGAVLLHRALAARTADAPAEAPAFSQPPAPTEAPAAPSEPPAVSEPEPEPEAEPTLADTIRTAEACDLSQWPELADALQGSTNASFMAIDLASGKTLACQPDTALYIASAIKAPYALYVCRQLDAGNVFEDEAIEYQEKFYDEGSGNIKSAQPGTMYRLDYLLQESILHSDNIAYRLLVNRCGKEDFNAMLDSLGITEGMHFTATNIWPKATPRELALCWNEIYNYIQSGAPHSALLAQILTNSSAYSPIRKAFVYQRTVAAKYGWDQTSYVDAGIVYSAEGQPQYLLAILTENGELENGGALAITTKLIRQIDAAMASMQ